jgi:hypothetical protein
MTFYIYFSKVCTFIALLSLLCKAIKYIICFKYLKLYLRIPLYPVKVSYPCHPDQFWDPSDLLSNGYQGLFPWGLNQPGCETNNLSLGQGIVDLCIHSLICLHDVVLNYLSTGTTLF